MLVKHLRGCLGSGHCCRSLRSARECSSAPPLGALVGNIRPEPGPGFPARTGPGFPAWTGLGFPASAGPDVPGHFLASSRPAAVPARIRLPGTWPRPSGLGFLGFPGIAADFPGQLPGGPPREGGGDGWVDWRPRSPCRPRTGALAPPVGPRLPLRVGLAGAWMGPFRGAAPSGRPGAWVAAAARAWARPPPPARAARPAATACARSSCWIWRSSRRPEWFMKDAAFSGSLARAVMSHPSSPKARLLAAACAGHRHRKCSTSSTSAPQCAQAGVVARPITLRYCATSGE